MRIKLAAGLVVLVLAVVGAWFFLQSTEITVWLYTDYAFRFNHKDWPALVQQRFRDANQVYQRSGARVRWKVLDASQTDPVANVSGVDNRRANLMFRAKDQADVRVVLTGVQERDRTGSSSAFTRNVFVIDFPNESEAVNTQLLATQLSVIFGAPAGSAGLAAIKNEKPANKLPANSVAIVNAMRKYPFKQGIDGLSQGDWKRKAMAAIAAYDKTPKMNAEAHAHTVLAATLLNERKREQAIPHFEQAVKLEPKSVPARLNLAEAYTRNGEEEKAVKEVREVVRLAPDDAFSHRALGAILGRAHHTEEAVKELEKAVQMNPNDADTRVLLGMELGRIFGRLDDAIAALREAARINPNARLANEGIIQAETLKKNLAEVVGQQRAAIQRNPSDPEAYYKLGRAEARLGDLNGAIRDFQKSADLMANNGAAHLELAEVYLVKGEAANAWTEVKKAREQGVDVPSSLLVRLSAQQ